MNLVLAILTAPDRFLGEISPEEFTLANDVDDNRTELEDNTAQKNMCSLACMCVKWGNEDVICVCTFSVSPSFATPSAAEAPPMAWMTSAMISNEQNTMISVIDSKSRHSSALKSGNIHVLGFRRLY